MKDCKINFLGVFKNYLPNLCFRACHIISFWLPWAQSALRYYANLAFHGNLRIAWIAPCRRYSLWDPMPRESAKVQSRKIWLGSLRHCRGTIHFYIFPHWSFKQGAHSKYVRYISSWRGRELHLCHHNSQTMSAVGLSSLCRLSRIVWSSHF